jgi:hypothetical protein
MAKVADNSRTFMVAEPGSDEQEMHRDREQKE